MTTQTTTTQPLAPYLICRGAAQAIDFYRAVFGANEVFRLVDPQQDKSGTPS
jgi:PhnB protein